MSEPVAHPQNGGDSPAGSVPWILAIEASNPSAGDGTAGVAGALLGPDGPGGIIEERFKAASRDRDGLLPAIDSVRARLGVRPGDLARICVSQGPGGYTGLRVSVTVAKSIAMTTGAQLVGVPSASVAPGETTFSSGFVVCLASKGDRTFATTFTDSGDLVGNPVGLITEADIPRIREKIVVADRFLPEPIRAAWIKGEREILSPRFTASRCLTIGYGLPPVDPIDLAPVYAREPEAVRLWNERRSAES